MNVHDFCFILNSIVINLICCFTICYFISKMIELRELLDLMMFVIYNTLMNWICCLFIFFVVTKRYVTTFSVYKIEYKTIKKVVYNAIVLSIIYWSWFICFSINFIYFDKAMGMSFLFLAIHTFIHSFLFSGIAYNIYKECFVWIQEENRKARIQKLREIIETRKIYSCLMIDIGYDGTVKNWITNYIHRKVKNN